MKSGLNCSATGKTTSFKKDTEILAKEAFGITGLEVKDYRLSPRIFMDELRNEKLERKIF